MTLGGQGQPGLHSDQDSQGHKERLSLKSTNQSISQSIKNKKPLMVAHTCNPSTGKVELENYQEFKAILG